MPMIDTMTLAIKMGKVKILNSTKFNKKYNLQNDTDFGELLTGYQSTKRTNSKEETNKYGYLPVVAKCSYPHSEGVLAIRFSFQKLVLGNNLFEVDDAYFEDAVKLLKEKLAYMEIETDEEAIRNAAIWEIHIGKNVNLSGKTSCYNILSTLNKIGFHKRLQASETNYIEAKKSVHMSNGKQFCLYCNKYNIAFYDKLAETEKTPIGRELVAKCKERNITDVLRIEYRLVKSKSVKDICKRCEIHDDIVFNTICSNDILQKIMMNMWNELIVPKLPVIGALNQDLHLFVDKLQQLGISNTDKIKAIGYWTLYQEKTGENLIKELFNSRTNIIYRMKDILRQVAAISDTSLVDLFLGIGDELKQATPLHL